MRRKKLCIIVFILLICIIICIFNSIRYVFLQEDLLFFQCFGSVSKGEEQIHNQLDIPENRVKRNKARENLNTQQIMFEVQYRNTKLKDINLMETVHHKTLVNEKIAPGTSGAFTILLNAKENMYYEINFESKNTKPSNLQFYILQNDKRYNTLEELDDILNGEILKNEEKAIPIYWEWCYEIDKENDELDTIEAKKIREYDFLIYVKGY